MDGYSTKKKLYIAVELALVVAALAVAVVSSRTADWQPLDLCLLLFALTAVGDRMILTIRHQHLTAAFIAEVLTMALLGPAPAVAFGVIVWLVDALHRRLPLLRALGDLSSAVTFLAAGGLLVRVIIGDPHAPSNHLATQSVTFGLLIFGLFMATNAANFALVAAHHSVFESRPLLRQAREVFLPLLPGQIAAAALAAILGVAYTNLGYPVLLGMVLVLLIFQYLGIALLRSEDRADQLEARSVHLASLQLGVLSTLVETLALRDRSTARHAAAVAHFARELAREIGCSEGEQDLAHTAGLLHDIGKFALPDRILHAEVLSEDDWAVIRRHPQDGATLVGRLDGYGPVAEAILYHHEHVDGSGYPAGLIGNEIPLASRILAICSTYDTLTARDTYRSPMTPQDAMAELRRVAGRQLDSELVRSFVELLDREGSGAALAGEKADFEAELAFGRRARAIAQPAPR
jgi:putative nucleotidyltransferase with HDIG domain